MTSTLTRPAPRPRAPMDPRIRQRRTEVTRLAGRRRLRILLAAGGAVLVVLSGVGLAESPWLAVSQIRVEGVGPSRAPAVAAAAGPARHHPLVSVSLGAIVRAEEALPWVEQATVSRSWPSTLIVRVRPRLPVAVVADGAGWAEVDPTGRVVELSGSRPGDYPAVLPGAGGIRAGQSVPAATAAAVRLAATLPAGLRSSVRTIAGVADGSVTLVLNQGITVVLGPPQDLGEKLSDLQTVLAQVDLSGVRTIDLRIPGQPALTRQ